MEKHPIDKLKPHFSNQELDHWEGLQSLVKVQSERRTQGDSSLETRYYITSLPLMQTSSCSSSVPN